MCYDTFEGVHFVFVQCSAKDHEFFQEAFERACTTAVPLQPNVVNGMVISHQVNIAVRCRIRGIIVLSVQERLAGESVSVPVYRHVNPLFDWYGAEAKQNTKCSRENLLTVKS